MRCRVTGLRLLIRYCATRQDWEPYRLPPLPTSRRRSPHLFGAGPSPAFQSAILCAFKRLRPGLQNPCRASALPRAPRVVSFPCDGEVRSGRCSGLGINSGEIMRAITVGFFCLIAAACGQQGGQSQPKGLTAADAAFQKQLQEQFLDAKPGTVIEIPAGKHALDRVLTLRASGVTIRGAGTDSSILSFKNEISGPEGILVYGSDFIIENLSIEDTKGDGLKINDGENITIRGVRVAWTGGPQTSNGAYGIYPVSSRNVLIENSSSWGAADAGIYVGQSIGVIVRNCHAEQNVAGIEIENTINADRS